MEWLGEKHALNMRCSGLSVICVEKVRWVLK